VNIRDLAAPVISDGALGTEFLSRGAKAGDCLDLLNVTSPELVREVIGGYAAAGSNVVLTATFRANAISLAGWGLTGKVSQINYCGVRNAREAVAGRSKVFASVGPTGEMLSVDEELRPRLLGVFEEQTAALADAGADAIVLETFSDLEEAKVALEAAQKTGLPVIVSFAFDTGKNKDRTMTGVTPERAAQAITEAGAAAVGANCGVGIDGYIEICRRMRAATTLPLWFKPNAGLPEVVGDKAVYHTSPDDFAARVPALLEAGATFVGACCGSNPDFIRAIAARVKGARGDARHAHQGN
jgi:methionine synthase I (cobalamin-dependent)